jgi:hypothetical protein
LKIKLFSAAMDNTVKNNFGRQKIVCFLVVFVVGTGLISFKKAFSLKVLWA